MLHRSRSFDETDLLANQIQQSSDEIVHNRHISEEVRTANMNVSEPMIVVQSPTDTITPSIDNEINDHETIRIPSPAPSVIAEPKKGGFDLFRCFRPHSEVQNTMTDNRSRDIFHNFMFSSPALSALAREIQANLDTRSTQESKKVARRIFEAFSPSTLLFITQLRDKKAREPSNEVNLIMLFPLSTSRLESSHNSQDRTVDTRTHENAPHKKTSQSLPTNDNFTTAHTVHHHSTAPGSDTKKETEECIEVEALYSTFATREEAFRAFQIFDKDGNGSISRQEMKDTVVSVYKDRKALSASLRDVGSAVGKLDIMLSM
jgi:hypothetical protein